MEVITMEKDNEVFANEVVEKLVTEVEAALESSDDLEAKAGEAAVDSGITDGEGNLVADTDEILDDNTGLAPSALGAIVTAREMDHHAGI
jgi:hypothetical protein